MMKLNYNRSDKLIEEIKNTEVPKEALAFWNLGQSGILIKGGDINGMIAIDPYLTYSIEENDPHTEFKRAFPPPVLPEELKDIDGVLITHFHDDHLDISTLERMKAVSDKVVFALPASHKKILEQKSFDFKRIIAVQENKPFILGGFQITPLVVAHSKYDTDEQGNPFYFGYFIEQNGVRFFHSGDTIVNQKIIDEVSEFYPDVIFLPINGGDFARTRRGIIGNMNYREAADFAVDVKADLVVPVHYDMFPNNRDNPSYFVDYIINKHQFQKFHMMIPGERFIYIK